jgi:hypothetical protein
MKEIIFNLSKCANLECPNDKDWQLNDLVDTTTMDDELRPILCDSCLIESRKLPVNVGVPKFVTIKNTAKHYLEKRALLPFKITEAVARTMVLNDQYKKDFLEIEGELYSAFFEYTPHNSNSFKIKVHLINKSTKKEKIIKLEDFLNLEITNLIRKINPN